MKPEEFSFSTYGVVKGAKLDITFKGTGYYPPACRGVVEKVYPHFAMVRTKHYRVTIHYTDLITGTASVQPAQGADPAKNVVWLPESWEMARPARGRAAVR